MKVTQEFLREIQRAGWVIAWVDDNVAVGECPRAGCGLRTNLRPGAHIPQACPGTGTFADVPLNDYEHMRAFLIKRRELLALSQAETEFCIGLSEGHLAKIETGIRIHKLAATLFGWAAGLGFQIVLRPVGLPPKSLSVIAQGRARAAVKRRRYAERRQLR